ALCCVVPPWEEGYGRQNIGPQVPSFSSTEGGMQWRQKYKIPDHRLNRVFGHYESRVSRGLSNSDGVRHLQIGGPPPFIEGPQTPLTSEAPRYRGLRPGTRGPGGGGGDGCPPALHGQRLLPIRRRGGSSRPLPGSPRPSTPARL